MACCGGKRRQGYIMTATEDIAMPGPGRSTIVSDAVMFEYFGPTRMAVKGPMTGRVYRFNNTGARVAIDRRDVPSVTAVPNLKRV